MFRVSPQPVRYRQPEQIRSEIQFASTTWKLWVFFLISALENDSGVETPPRSVKTEVAIATNANLAENFAITDPSSGASDAGSKPIDNDGKLSGNFHSDFLVADLFQLRNHLKALGFRSAPPLDGEFETQVHTYFTRPNGGETRIFILTGHGIRAGEFRVGSETYTADRLKTTLIDVPSPVHAIPMICCCDSGAWTKKLHDGEAALASMKCSAIAACSSTEDSNFTYDETKRTHGNHFLTAFLDTLKSRGADWCNTWEALLKRIQPRLNRMNTVDSFLMTQTPEYWGNTPIGPRVALKYLMPPPPPSWRVGSSAVGEPKN